MLRVFTYGRERLVAYLTLALKRRTIHLSEMTRRRVVAWPRGCHLARTRAYRNLPPKRVNLPSIKHVAPSSATVRFHRVAAWWPPTVHGDAQFK